MKSNTLASLTALGVVSASCFGQQYLPVIGGPEYDEVTGIGYNSGTGLVINNAGVAAGTASNEFSRVISIRWDASGTAATELAHFYSTAFSTGIPDSAPSAINDAGTVVGYAISNDGFRAVLWNASGTALTVLEHLGTSANGFTDGKAYDINEAGIVVGRVEKYIDGVFKGDRAVRWDTTGAVTELGNTGTYPGGSTSCGATAISASGVIVGWANKYSPVIHHGPRAVRWDASGTAATELEYNGGTNPYGSARSEALLVNDTGTILGGASKYYNGTFLGPRVLRWDASGTAATELGHLGTNLGGSTEVNATGLNNSGVAVGYTFKYDGNTFLGFRAVRWEASGTAATELANFGMYPSGYGGSFVFAINNSGYAVGTSAVFDPSGTPVEGGAAIWDPHGNVIDLNTLINPNSGWILQVVNDISDTNWVTGSGSYDPDGSGPLQAYQRAFSLQYIESSSCYVDCDESGDLNILDYICFGDAYAIQDPYADCDNNGTLSILDYICFGDAFAAGCP